MAHIIDLFFCIRYTGQVSAYEHCRQLKITSWRPIESEKTYYTALAIPFSLKFQRKKKIMQDYVRDGVGKNAWEVWCHPEKEREDIWRSVSKYYNKYANDAANIHVMTSLLSCIPLYEVHKESCYGESNILRSVSTSTPPL